MHHGKRTRVQFNSSHVHSKSRKVYYDYVQCPSEIHIEMTTVSGSVCSQRSNLDHPKKRLLVVSCIGTSVGSKVTKVAERVATDTAEDLRKAAGSFEGVIPGM